MTDVTAAALARNDRFLHEFVEKWDICPFARQCRETGALERRVLEQESPDVEAALPAVRELASDAFAHVEVALLLFPRLALDFAAFERFVTALRDARGSEENPLTFYMVAFHPDSPPDTDDPHRLVSLLRRSPDPTIQLVRASLLERIRGRNTEDTLWVDPDTVDYTKPFPRRAPTMSTRIAEVNFEKVAKIGAHALLELLAGMRPR